MSISKRYSFIPSFILNIQTTNVIYLISAVLKMNDPEESFLRISSLYILLRLLEERVHLILSKVQ